MNEFTKTLLAKKSKEIFAIRDDIIDVIVESETRKEFEELTVLIDFTGAIVRLEKLGNDLYSMAKQCDYIDEPINNTN